MLKEEAKILQILVFCLFFGVAVSKLEKERRDPLINGVNAIVDAMVWMINIVKGLLTHQKSNLIICF